MLLPLKNFFRGLMPVFFLCSCSPVASNDSVPTLRHRVIVSTDIGGTDFDDYQSLVHLLVYADTFDIEGIISSPYGEGRKEHIFEALEAYAMDYPSLKTFSDKYPRADSLGQLVKQGATDIPGLKGYDVSTEGSDWIITCAQRPDPRPLHVLIWGGIEDLAQALRDAPDILPKLRVYFIGGPNKKWSVNAYQYIAEHHPELWLIEANATYRGWFVGGDQSGQWSNTEFVERHIKGAGALGAYFYMKGGRMKMGDTPSLTRLLSGSPEDPGKASWGGRFVRAWERPHRIFHRLTTELDSIEQFGVLELKLPIGAYEIRDPVATMNIDRPIKAEVKNDTVRFLFSPKNSSVYSYTITSNMPLLDQQEGSITVYPPPESQASRPSATHPNWWTDDPSSEYVVSGYIGVKTVSRWRVDFLKDFAERMERCRM